MDSETGPKSFPAPILDPSQLIYSKEVRLKTGVSFTVALDESALDPISLGLQKGRIDDEYRLLIKLLSSVAPAGGRVLDLGGHVGTFAIAAAALGYQVVVVEASPRNAGLLQASIDRNGFKELRLIHAAVSDRPGTLEFCPYGPYGHVANSETSLARVSVPAIAVDDLLDELGWAQLDFIKMDIEGSEVAGLLGMTRTLSSPDAPPLYVESNGHALAFFEKTPDDLKRVIHSYGYRTYLYEEEGLTPVQPGDLQPTTVTDYLAIKSIPQGLKEWRSDRGLTTKQVADRALASALSRNPNERRYIAQSLGAASATLRNHPTVRTIIHGLRADMDESVRVAVGTASHGIDTLGKESLFGRLFKADWIPTRLRKFVLERGPLLVESVRNYLHSALRTPRG